MFPILFRFGHFALHTYGLMVALGFLAAFGIARRQFRQQNINEALLDRLVVGLMISGLVGARVCYFLFENFTGLRDDPLSFFRIWEGGLVFYGGFVVAWLYLVFFSIHEQVSYFSLSDVLVGPLLIGQAFGRLGCFAAGCCFGKPTDAFWGVIFKSSECLAPTYIRLHPTQLYEAAGDVILFFILSVIRRRSPQAGLVSGYYLLGYGTLRFLLEFLRNDDRGPMSGGLSPSQWISIGLFVAGCATVVYARKKTNT
jgi:phosphatidylglycerol---prolipoprotein diacylglyceryl transferase